VSQTKYCCSFKVKIFGPSQNFRARYATGIVHSDRYPLQAASVMFCFLLDNITDSKTWSENDKFASELSDTTIVLQMGHIRKCFLSKQNTRDRAIPS